MVVIDEFRESRRSSASLPSVQVPRNTVVENTFHRTIDVSPSWFPHRLLIPQIHVAFISSAVNPQATDQAHVPCVEDLAFQGGSIEFRSMRTPWSEGPNLNPVVVSPLSSPPLNHHSAVFSG
jgi:hypothetical protein